jgi:hypothetical protein
LGASTLRHDAPTVLDRLMSFFTILAPHGERKSPETRLDDLLTTLGTVAVHAFPEPAECPFAPVSASRLSLGSTQSRCRPGCRLGASTCPAPAVQYGNSKWWAIVVPLLNGRDLFRMFILTPSRVQTERSHHRSSFQSERSQLNLECSHLEASRAGASTRPNSSQARGSPD